MQVEGSVWLGRTVARLSASRARQGKPTLGYDVLTDKPIVQPIREAKSPMSAVTKPM